MSFAAKSGQSLEKAIALHQQGHFEKAKNAYREFLKYNPNHPDAIHLLGLIHYQEQN